jgi:hypothetical protein
MPASVSFNLINLGGLKFGNHVSFSYSPGSQHSAEPLWATASELPLPFQDLNANPHPISLLSWHTSLSDFVGRSNEMSLLGEWAKSDVRVSVMVLSGTGGSGKSRLAAEFGRAMRRQGWSAGFVNLEKNVTFRLSRTGAVLLIDYPEEHLEFVRAFLASLARSEYPTKVRVLLITRRSFVQCADLFKQSRCEDIVHGTPLLLQPIDRNDLYRLYTSAVDRAAERLQTIPLPLSEEAFAQWVTASSENNLPLFVTAAAAHAALYPSDIVIRYTGKQVVAALIDRELRRLGPTSLSLGLPPQGVGRVLAIATLAGGIEAAALPNMRALPALGFGDADLEKAVDQAGLLADGIIHPLKPDIIGAALTAQVLSSDDQAPEWVWFALTCNGKIEASCSRLARMIHDERMAFDDRESIIAQHFANAIGESLPRLAKVAKYFQSVDIPHSLAGIEEAVWRGLARLGPGAVKALALNNLASCLINRKKFDEAFAARRIFTRGRRNCSEREAILSRVYG